MKRDARKARALLAVADAARLRAAMRRETRMARALDAEVKRLRAALARIASSHGGRWEAEEARKALGDLWGPVTEVKR